jgi:hypothetical protein
MANHWQPLPTNDPLYRIHALLHDAVDEWATTARLSDSSSVVIGSHLEISLHGERAVRLARIIKTGAGGAFTEIVSQEMNRITEENQK